MTGLVDKELPDLSTQDPRICPGRNDYAETVRDLGEAPYWLGPEPWSGPHDWGSGASYCRWCSVNKDQVRDRFRDWRYEELITQLKLAVEALAEAMENK